MRQKVIHVGMRDIRKPRNRQHFTLKVAINSKRTALKAVRKSRPEWYYKVGKIKGFSWRDDSNDSLPKK